MVRMKPLQIAVPALFLLAVAANAPAQSAGSPSNAGQASDAPEFGFKTSLTNIVAPTLVTDRAGNIIDGRTAVEWGWANRCVDEAQLVAEVKMLAERIALVPPEIIRIKKLSINRAMEAMGIKAATASISEMDALLHMSSAVEEVRALIGRLGLKQAIAHFRGPTGPKHE